MVSSPIVWSFYYYFLAYFYCHLNTPFSDLSWKIKIIVNAKCKVNVKTPLFTFWTFTFYFWYTNWMYLTPLWFNLLYSYMNVNQSFNLEKVRRCKNLDIVYVCVSIFCHGKKRSMLILDFTAYIFIHKRDKVVVWMIIFRLFLKSSSQRIFLRKKL